MEVLSKALEAMVVTLREGVEAALVVGIVLAYLRKTGKGHLSSRVFRGLWAAVLVSLLGAAAIQWFGLDPENEVLEGAVMWVAAGLVGSLLVWMWRTGRTLKQRMETRLSAVTSGGTGFGLFLFTFFMVLREGVETVLFLFALSVAVGANAMYNVVGGSLGLLLAALFGVLLVKGSVRIDLKRFFAATGLVLALLVVKLFANGLHEFFEAGLLPSTPALLGVVGFLTQESASVFILAALIALPALTMLWEAWRRAPEPSGPLTPPERRKWKSEVRRGRRWTTAAAAVALAISVFLGLSLAVSASRGYDPAPTRLPFRDVIRIPLKEIGRDPMRKYTVAVDGVDVRFFVVRDKEGKLAIALDACLICPLKGYSLKGGQVVCNNCGAPIAFETIGIAGGCNPIPLKAVVEKDEIVVRGGDLAEGRARFARQ